MRQISFLILIISIFIVGCNRNKNNTNNSDTKQDTTLNIESITEQIRENPKNAQLFIQRANLQIDAENIPEAINDLQIALRVDSLMPDVYLQLGELFMTRGESGKAKDTFEKCLKLFPENAEARLNLAQIYFYVQMYKDAMTEVLTLEKNNLQSSKSYFLKALIFIETESNNQAIEALKKSIEFDKNNWEAYNLIGILHYRLNNEISVEYFKTATKLFPNNLEIRFNAGLVYQHFELYESAITEYDYVLKADSLYYKAYFNKGNIYTTGIIDYNKALECFTTAIKIDSTAYKAWYNRGYVYEATKNYKLAEMDYRKALKIMPNYDLAVEGLNEVIAKQM